MRKYSLLVLVLFSVLFRAGAQQYIYNFDFTGIFDNREYFNNYINDQTIFGTRLRGEAGYAFNPFSRIMAGADFLYEFGSKDELGSPDITAYYEGTYRNFRLEFGAFNRLSESSCPMSLLADTVFYYRPNIEGIRISFKTPSFNHNLWIDWTGRQSMDKRETFLLGFSGFAQKGIFTYQHHAIMTHLAHSKDSSLHQPIRDNAGFQIMPGLNLARFFGIDSLTLAGGMLLSYDRIRSIYDFRFPLGFIAEIHVIHRGLGLHGVVYKGEGQVITSGDAFYRSGFYTRTDLFYQVSQKNLSGRVQFSMHFIPGVTDLSMSLILRARLDGIFKAHQFNAPK
jgi:hypothetical protein